MRIILNEIFDTLEHLGYMPYWNKANTGFTFNFNMELALCYCDEKSMVVTFMIPCAHKIEYKDVTGLIRRINARNHVGRLVDIDGTAVSAISSFYAFDDDTVVSQTYYALEDLERLINEFYEYMIDL